MIQTQATNTAPGCNAADREAFERDGYVIVRGMFSREEMQEMAERYQRLADSDWTVGGHWRADRPRENRLGGYPRIMHPHRFDQGALQALLKPEAGAVLENLLQEPAVACQSMYFFKAPGSAGQSLHQDNFYLAVSPASCVAAWTAVDRADPENGGLYVAPGSHRGDIQCPDPEEFRRFNRTNLAELPEGTKAIPAELDVGDTLFFHGGLIHGSGRNKSADRWRRSFVCHYMPVSSTHINRGYFPVLDFAGNEVSYEAAQAGGPCGYSPGQGIPNTYGIDADLAWVPHPA
jgi:ectoine hydroxylase-related dioxygenase (phytanoyl-CoA dioxygenase family)